jgi:nicotinamidase-related amidase
VEELTPHAATDPAALGGALPRGGRPVVLVVDLTTGFTDPRCGLGAELGEEVLSTRLLLDAAREHGAPVIFTAVRFAPGLEDAGLWVRKLPGLAELREDGPWAELDERLARRTAEPIVVKKGASALFGTNLVALLQTRRADTVVLAGATTSGCVRATAVDLLQWGFPCLVARECVGDRDAEAHHAALRDMQAKYADVLPLAEVLDYLRQTTTR